MTVACRDCPALMVFGVVIPLIPNALPVRVIIDTVKSAEPRLFKTRFAVPFSPFDTVPKSIEVGATDNCGWVVVTAVARRLATTGGLPASAATVRVPVTFPGAAGSTATPNVPDCPTPSAMGKLAPARLNCVLEKVACVILIATVPAFETETVCAVGLPTDTLPKLIAVGFSWKRA